MCRPLSPWSAPRCVNHHTTLAGPDETGKNPATMAAKPHHPRRCHIPDSHSSRSQMCTSGPHLENTLEFTTVHFSIFSLYL